MVYKTTCFLRKRCGLGGEFHLLAASPTSSNGCNSGSMFSGSRLLREAPKIFCHPVFYGSDNLWRSGLIVSHGGAA